MQCQGTTKFGTECSRKATSDGCCWQHQSSDSKFDNNSTNTGIDNKILKEWLYRIKVQTPFEQITSDQIPLLWYLYQNRVDDLPTPDLLQQAIDQGLDKYLFYSKKFEYEDNLGLLEEYSESNVFTEQQLTLLNQELKDFIDINRVRKGDVVHFLELGDYGLLIYNGNKLIDLSIEITTYGSVPEEIQINDFPIVEYFLESITQNMLINFNTKGNQLKYVSDYTSGEEPVYQYVTVGKDPGYIIWTSDIDFLEKWEGILPFTVGSEGLEVFSDVAGSDFKIESKGSKKYHNFRELYDVTYN